jgi:single-strand DNA-binding protein
MSINSVCISGRIGQAPELFRQVSGATFLRFSMAVNDRRRTHSGSWQDVPNWVPVVFFGPRAEALEKILVKGSKVFVSGHLSQSHWTTEDGQSRSALSVICSEIDIMSKPLKKQEEPPQNQQPPRY